MSPGRPPPPPPPPPPVLTQWPVRSHASLTLKQPPLAQHSCPVWPHMTQWVPSHVRLAKLHMPVPGEGVPLGDGFIIVGPWQHSSVLSPQCSHWPALHTCIGPQVTVEQPAMSS